MVRLEVQGRTLLDLLQIDFNSKMVRLEVSRRKFYCEKIALFQFQDGTIRSLWKITVVILKFLISIPRWYD